MALENELGLRNPITVPAHEAVLNIYYTASRIRKRAGDFFRSFGLTDVQFNLMMLLKHQSQNGGGLTQVQLSRMMLVNRANITSLIDRMEKAELVVRTPRPGDRRYNLIKLTARGGKLLLGVEQAYIEEVRKIMGVLKESGQKRLITMLEKIRAEIT